MKAEGYRISEVIVSLVDKTWPRKDEELHIIIYNHDDECHYYGCINLFAGGPGSYYLAEMYNEPIKDIEAFDEHIIDQLGEGRIYSYEGKELLDAINAIFCFFDAPVVTIDATVKDHIDMRDAINNMFPVEAVDYAIYRKVPAEETTLMFQHEIRVYTMEYEGREYKVEDVGNDCGPLDVYFYNEKGIQITDPDILEVLEGVYQKALDKVRY